MKIEAIFPRQNFAFEALGEENANAGNVNNNPPANDPKNAPAGEPKNKDKSREGLDDQAKMLGKVLGVLFGKNPMGSDDPTHLGKVMALPGLTEKFVLGLYGWLFGIIPVTVLGGPRALGEFTEGMLGIVGKDTKKSEEQPIRNIYQPPPTPIQDALELIPENDPLRAELKEAKDLLKLYDPPDEDDDMGPNRQLGARSNLRRVEDKIRAKAEAIQKEINKLPYSIKSASSSEAILKEYQERLYRLNHLVETETRPHKLDDWLRALERVEAEYPTLKRWLELKDLYDKQKQQKKSRSNGVTYDLPANDKIAGLLAKPETGSQFGASPAPNTSHLPVNNKLTGLIAQPEPQLLTAVNSTKSNVVIQTAAQPLSDKQNPFYGLRPIPLTYDLPVNNKLTRLIAEPAPQPVTAVNSANSNVGIQTVVHPSSDKQNPFYGLRPIPLTYDLPVNNKIAGLALEPVAQQQSVSNQPLSNSNTSDEKSKALTTQLRLKTGGLLA